MPISGRKVNPERHLTVASRRSRDLRDLRRRSTPPWALAPSTQTINWRVSALVPGLTGSAWSRPR